MSETSKTKDIITKTLDLIFLKAWRIILVDFSGFFWFKPREK